jgi:hypothetical protein
MHRALFRVTKLKSPPSDTLRSIDQQIPGKFLFMGLSH